MRSVPTGIAALTIMFVVAAMGLRGIGSANAVLPADDSAPKFRTPNFQAMWPSSLESAPSGGSQNGPAARFQLASLETRPVDLPAVRQSQIVKSPPVAPAGHGDSFEARFSFDRRVISFEDRFAASGIATNMLASAYASAAEAGETQDISILPPPAIAEPAKTRLIVARSATKVASIAPTAPVGGDEGRRSRASDAARDPSLPPETGEHTAIYDISAHMVYMPNGDRLEAHSGLGPHLDDPRYVSEKNRGPTPPNVYNITLRERPFHGVRALRLTPVGGGQMFGRDGILAHSYMLGPNGQSNGCVSFSDYPAFLNAVLSGDVDRLVVVEHLESPPDSKTASGWLPQAIKNLFSHS